MLRAVPLLREDVALTVATPGPGPLTRACADLGVPTLQLPVRGWCIYRLKAPRQLARLPAYARNVARARAVLRDLRFDLVHVNSLDALEPALAARSLGIPVVAHARESLRDNVYGAAIGWRNVLRGWSAVAAHTICVSHHVRDQVLAAGERPSRASVVYDPAPDPGPPSPPVGPPTLGTVAAIHPRKGFEVVLDAFAVVRASLPEARLRLVGGGKPWAERALRRRARRLGLGASVTFTGEVPDAGPHVEAMTAFALPSTGEAFGLVYLEALLRGRPAIGVTPGGAGEILRPGRTGALIAPGDAEALAAAALPWLEDPEEAYAWGLRGRADVLARFHEDGLRGGILAAYERVWGGGWG